MANTHQSYSYSQSSPFVAALRLRAPRRRAAAPAWRVACAAALAASAAATACGSTDARLESDACHRQLVGFGAVAERFAHYQQQYTRNATAALAAVTSHTAIERATALAKQQQKRFATRQQQLLTPSKTATTTTTTLAPLRTKAIQHEYDLQSVVGEGGFGRVHAARHRATNAPVALKRVFKATTTREQFLHEVAILQHVRGGNTNVLQLRDAFETSDAYVLVTDLVAGGELFDALLDDGAFDECRAQLLVRELASALSFLHDRNVVHGDVKPENVLLGSDGCGAQLVDFGQAFRADEAAECARALGSGFGTTAYAAPEFLGRSEAGPAADMWALGVVLFVVLCGRHPFDPTNTLDDDAIATRIRSGEFAKDAPEWLQVSASARDLVERLLTLDPRMRFTAEEVLKHDWLASDDGAIAV